MKKTQKEAIEDKISQWEKECSGEIDRVDQLVWLMARTVVAQEAQIANLKHLVDEARIQLRNVRDGLGRCK